MSVFKSCLIGAVYLLDKWFEDPLYGLGKGYYLTVLPQVCSQLRFINSVYSLNFCEEKTRQSIQRTDQLRKIGFEEVR